jgi:hypothetical protein
MIAISASQSVLLFVITDFAFRVFYYIFRRYPCQLFYEYMFTVIRNV